MQQIDRFYHKYEHLYVIKKWHISTKKGDIGNKGEKRYFPPESGNVDNWRNQTVTGTDGNSLPSPTLS